MSGHHSGPGTVSLHRQGLQAPFSDGGCLIIKVEFFTLKQCMDLRLLKPGGKASHLNVAEMSISCLDILPQLSWKPAVRK